MGQTKSTSLQLVDDHGITISPYLHQHRGYPYRHYTNNGILRHPDYPNRVNEEHENQQLGPHNGSFLTKEFTLDCVPDDSAIKDHPLEGLSGTRNVINEPKPDYSITSSSDNNVRDSLSDFGTVTDNPHENGFNQYDQQNTIGNTKESMFNTDNKSIVE